MRWSGWGFRERRWKKAPDEEIQPAKTVWDVLQLLIVPVVLAVVALLFNASQASHDRSRAETLRQNEALNTYFNEMSDLMLNRHLGTSEVSGVRDVARAFTIATVRQLDGERKGLVIRFLVKAGLLQRSAELPTVSPPVDLTDADLRGANLARVSFMAAHLDGADLRGAKFDGAQLRGTSFSGAHLRGASFNHALLDDVSFAYADLSAAVLDDATIADTSFAFDCLTDASFVGALFDPTYLDVTRHTDFSGADGRHVDFRRTKDLLLITVWEARFPDVRLDGAFEAPPGWGRAERPQELCNHQLPDWPHEPSALLARFEPAAPA